MLQIFKVTGCQRVFGPERRSLQSAGHFRVQRQRRKCRTKGAGAGRGKIANRLLPVVAAHLGQAIQGLLREDVSGRIIAAAQQHLAVPQIFAGLSQPLLHRRAARRRARQSRMQRFDELQLTGRQLVLQLAGRRPVLRPSASQMIHDQRVLSHGHQANLPVAFEAHPNAARYAAMRQRLQTGRRQAVDLGAVAVLGSTTDSAGDDTGPMVNCCVADCSNTMHSCERSVCSMPMRTSGAGLSTSSARVPPATQGSTNASSTFKRWSNRARIRVSSSCWSNGERELKISPRMPEAIAWNVSTRICSGSTLIAGGGPSPNADH